MKIWIPQGQEQTTPNGSERAESQDMMPNLRLGPSQNRILANAVSVIYDLQHACVLQEIPSSSTRMYSEEISFTDTLQLIIKLWERPPSA